jgi:general secretion pathway protein I
MKRSNYSRRARRGFTLLEVLIALAIVVMAVGALLGTITSSASNVAYLRSKTLAEWVALNRLTEVRISQQMPDTGRRTGNAVMGGMRWQWEQEVTELPIKGMFRVEVRARPTGETVDDSRPEDKPTSQKDSDSQASGSSTDKLSWTTTVTGIVSSARSDRRDAIATPFRGNNTTPGGPQSPGNGPNTPGAPGTPGNPGGPANPNNPRAPGPRPPPPTDR